MSGAGVLPPYGIVTPDDHSAYLNLTAYVTIVMTLIFVTTRLIMRNLVFRTWHSNDHFILLAMVFAVIQTILVHLSVDNGFGKQRGILSEDQVEIFSKYDYASQLILIITEYCAKTSMVLLVINIVVEKDVLYTSYAVIAFVGACAVALLFATAFQCRTPNPWDFTSSRCTNQLTILDACGALNIITDVGIIALAAIMVRRVQMPITKRLQIFSPFSVRILVCVTTIIYLAILPRNGGDFDKTRNNINAAIIRQFEMNLSVITACMPALKRFLSDLKANLMEIETPDRVELSYQLSRARTGSSTVEPSIDKRGSGGPCHMNRWPSPHSRHSVGNTRAVYSLTVKDRGDSVEALTIARSGST